GDVALLARRGHARMELGLVDGAIADLSSATKAHPKDAAMRIDLGLARTRVNQPSMNEQAIRAADDALKISPREPRAFVVRGIARFHLKGAAQALADFATAAQLDPKLADAIFWRGRVRFDQDQVEQARIDFELTMKIDPAYRDAYYWHGHCLLGRDPRHALDD